MGLTSKLRETTKSTPMSCSKLLSQHPEEPDHDGSFHYRRVIGKLMFIEKSTRADLAYAVHQCARFSEQPKVPHAKAVKWIGRYLLGTRDKGFIMSPDRTKGMEIHVDADFAGNWDPNLAGRDVDTARSRHGYIISYGGVPLLWQSQLQGEIALSSTESELIGLSTSLRTGIPIMRMLNEMKTEHKFEIHEGIPQVKIKCWEDNNSCKTIAMVPKQRPRTKHINCKYFHFAAWVEAGAVEVLRIDTEDQPADFLTKPLNEPSLVKHRKTVLGW